jgi:hypothetical protein
MRVRAVVCAAIVVAAGCGDEGDSGQSADENPTPQEEPAEPALECSKARRVLIEPLESSLTVEGGGGLKRVRVVEVEDPPDAPINGFKRGVYIVAGELTGPGMDGTIGTWAVSKSVLRTGGGLVMAVGSVTREFSDAGVDMDADSPVGNYLAELEDTDEYERAQACAEGG